MVYQKSAEATSDFIGNKITDAVWSKTLATRAKSYDGKTITQSSSSQLN